MKTEFYVFSGTGNTLRVCTLLSEHLQGLGNDVNIYPLRSDTKLHGESDCIIVGYPVHAFNAPLPVLEFLKRLPNTKRKIPVYFVQTSGEPLKMNFAAFIRPQRIVRKKGYIVLGGFSYVMPYNILFRHSDGMAARMWNVVKLRAPIEAEMISKRQSHLCRVNVLQRSIPFILRIEHSAMPIVGRYFKVTGDCIGCGLCEKLCPQGNIVMKDKKPVFGKHCTACMDCAFSCPKDAIRTSVLNGWRVNGKYDWNAIPTGDNGIGKYCSKSYLKYFRMYERLN